MAIKLTDKYILLAGASLALVSGAAHAQESAPRAASEEIVVTATGRAAAIQDVPIAVTAVTNETLEQAGVTDFGGVQRIAPSFRFGAGQSNSAGASAAIRGIGTAGDNPGFEPAVGVFIDGVFRSRAGVALSQLPEVERIEVLRGPQGTLFGRNTSGGAISIVTSAPEFETRVFGLAEAGDYGLIRARAGVTGGVVEDVLALRAEAGIEQRDGYFTDRFTGDDFNNRDRRYGRVQALWDISTNATLRVIADVNETQEQCCTAVYIKAGTPALIINSIIPNSIVVAPEERKVSVSPNRDLREDVYDYGLSAQLDYDIGDMTLTAISSYRDWGAIRNQDVDFNRLDRAYREKYTSDFLTMTQEVRLQGEAGAVDWLVGGFFFSEENELTDRIRFGAQARQYIDGITAATAQGLNAALGAPVLSANGSLYQSLGPSPLFFAEALPVLTGGLINGPTATAFANAVLASGPIAGQGQNADNYTVDTTGYAFFTHNEIALGEKATWTIGLRYNSEEKELTANLDATAAGCAVLQTFAPITAYLANPQGATAGQTAALRAALSPFNAFICNPVVNTVANGAYSDSTEEEAWSGTTSVSIKPTDDLLVYGGFSRGFKSGGYNLDRNGFKLNPGAATRPPVSDLRFGSEEVDAYELGAKLTALGGRAAINGNIFYQDISGYQVNAFSGFNFIVVNAPTVISQGFELDVNARLTDNIDLQIGYAHIDASFDEDVRNATGVIIASGAPLSGTSENTVSGALNFRFPLGQDLQARLFIDGRYESGYRTQTLGRDPITDQDAFAVFNARVGFGKISEAWVIEGFVRNIADEFYWVGSFGVPEQTGNFAVYPGEPRTYGVTVRANF